jgi:hypothetical protein
VALHVVFVSVSLTSISSRSAKGEAINISPATHREEHRGRIFPAGVEHLGVRHLVNAPHLYNHQNSNKLPAT